MDGIWALAGNLLRGFRIVFIAFRNILRNVHLRICAGDHCGSNIHWDFHDDGGRGVIEQIHRWIFIIGSIFTTIALIVMGLNYLGWFYVFGF